LRLLFIVSFTFSSFIAWPQFDNCYYIKLWRIEQHLYTEDPVINTNQLLDLETTYSGGVGNHYYMLASLFFQNKDTLQAINYLHKYFYSGGELDTDIYQVKISPDISDWYTKTITKIRNQVLIDKIDVIFDSDQAARRGSAPHDSLFFRHLAATDSVTGSLLKDIVQRYGFPRCKEIGNSRYFELYTIFLHLVSYDKLYDFFSPELKKAVYRGDIGPKYYCDIVERYNLRTKKGRLYGCYALDDPGVDFTFDSVIDVPDIDERRISIGLPPVNELLDNSLYSFPPNYRPDYKPCY